MALFMIALVITSCSGNNDAGSVPQSAGTTAAAPSTPASIQKTQQPQALEIKAGQSPEELAKSYIDLSNKWTNAGCDEETSKESDSQTSITLEEFSQKKATELATPYIVALFGPEYQSNPTAMKFLANGIKTNADVMKLYIMADPASNKDVKAHYKQSENFDAMVSSSQEGDTTTVIFDMHFENNSRDAPGVITETPSGQKARLTIQFKEVNGVERLVSANSMQL